MPEPLRIVFFGTPDYAVPTLLALANDARFTIPLVVTQPDRPAGRGRKLTPPPVKIAALELGLSIEQPESLKTAADRAQLLAVEADLFVVAAYGLIFGPKTLAIPRLGCVNLHASLLPAYRGASPISAAIFNGDPETGVTLMKMEQGLDTGPMIAARACPIEPTDTTQSLTLKLAELGALLALEAIPAFANGHLEPVSQPHSGATLVRPLLKSDGQIDWRRPATQIERLARAMWPWPRAWFTIGVDTIQVHAASVHEAETSLTGVVAIKDGEVLISTSDGAIRLDLLQFSGGNPVTGRQAAAAGRFVEGQHLESPLHDAAAIPMIRAAEPADERR